MSRSVYNLAGIINVCGFTNALLHDIEPYYVTDTSTLRYTIPYCIISHHTTSYQIILFPDHVYHATSGETLAKDKKISSCNRPSSWRTHCRGLNEQSLFSHTFDGGHPYVSRSEEIIMRMWKSLIYATSTCLSGRSPGRYRLYLRLNAM